MRYKWITIPETDFKVLEYTIYPTDDIYSSSYVKAGELAPRMNRHAPNGKLRSDEEIFANCFAGCIAESALIYRIHDFANFLGRENVSAHAVEYDRLRDDDQVDVVVESDKAKLTIEVRSSYGIVQNNLKRYTEWFSIVGYYVSANKGRELPKDYYITVIFNFSQEQMFEKIRNRDSISFQLAAGCDRNFLQKYGELDNLKNEGAVYKVIRPLIKGKPVNTVLKELFGRL